MRIIRMMICIAMSAICVAVAAQGQYSQDLAEYFTKFKSLVERAERTSPRNSGGKLAIQTEAVELQEKLAQLSQEAAKANLELAKAGEADSKSLLLIASSAQSLILANNLMLYYLYTGEKTFLVQSNSAVAIAKTLRDAAR